jgi:hypothetical protein
MTNEQYLLWIDGGCTSVAEIVKKTATAITVKNPHIVANIQYGLNAENQIVQPGDPAAVRTRFNTEMYPYYFAEYIGKDVEFTIKPQGSVCFAILDGSEDLPVIKQYKEVVANLG